MATGLRARLVAPRSSGLSLLFKDKGCVKGEWRFGVENAPVIRVCVPRRKAKSNAEILTLRVRMTNKGNERNDKAKADSLRE